MKSGKRFVSLVLALVMICSLMVNASAAETQEEIKAQLSYDITVSYNGETQALTDAAGNIVYPISYNGTTYLPVRAVSYVLGIAVDWDGATQTVLLSDGETAAPKAVPASDSPSGSKDITAQLDPGITVKYNGEVQTMTDAAGNTVYPVSYNGTTYLPVRAVSNMLGVAVDWDGTTQTVLLGGSDSDPRPDAKKPSTDKNDVFRGAQTSADAKVLGENHIGYDWAEIDWSTANDSYVRVKLNKMPGSSTIVRAYARWNDNGEAKGGGANDTAILSEGEWVNIPLTGGNTEYLVKIELSFQACEHYMTDEEKILYNDGPSELTARFNAEITNPDNRWLLSTYKIDWEHAPLTCEKAQEITKDCKTDAEKITAVFKWVSQNIKYDKAMAEDNAKKKTTTTPSTPIKKAEDYDSYEDFLIATYGCVWDPVKGAHRLPPDPLTDKELELLGYTNQNHLNLDYILTHKTGVCEHYAVLMTGMLRSIGVPCKLVEGWLTTSNSSKGLHAWVAVNPQTGTLDMSALGAGKDFAKTQIGEMDRENPTGWIRLDPTNAKYKTTTSNDENYQITDNC